MIVRSSSTASGPQERAKSPASASILRLSGPWAGRPPGLPETPFGKGRPLGLALGLPVVILLKLALPLLRCQRTWRQNWGCNSNTLSYSSNQDGQPFSCQWIESRSRPTPR